MDSSQALHLRIDASSQKDTVLGMFFESSLAHITKLHGAAAAEAARAEVFGKRSVVSFFRYPVADLLKLVDLSYRRGKGGDYHAAAAEFGRFAVRHFLESPVGKTMTLLAGGSAHRLLSSAPSGYKAVASFGERTYEKLGDKSAKMGFQGDLLGPGWQSGVVEQALEMVGGVKARVTPEAQNPAASNFVLRMDW